MARHSSAPTALAAARQIRDPLDEAPVVRQAERFLELRRQSFRTVVDVAVELGEILVATRPRLQGQYQRWLRERLGVEPATATNYVSLARLAREAPGVFQRFKELGTTKLYRVARLAPEARQQVLRTPALHDLTDQQFAALTEEHLLRRRPVTGNMRAHGMRERVRAFGRTVEAWRPPRIEDPSIRDGLRGDLLAASRALRALADRLR